MATLPNAKVAVKVELANYLRTNLAALYPDLVVSSQWPTPQKASPPKAVTIVAPGAPVVSFHQPVIWKTAPATGINISVLYSFGIAEIDLQLDVWTKYESHRDDLVTSIDTLLHKNPEITLGTTGGFATLGASSGLVIPLPSYFDVTADYMFVVSQNGFDTPNQSMTADWRATLSGKATVYLMRQEIVPSMAQITLEYAIGGEVLDTFQLAP